MSALSDLLNRYLAKEKFRDLSNRKVADAAGVSRGTIDNYRKGIHPAAPSEDILQAFHDLLGIPVVELREAAGVPHGEPDPYVAPAEFNRLSQTQRDELWCDVHTVRVRLSTLDPLETAHLEHEFGDEWLWIP